MSTETKMQQIADAINDVQAAMDGYQQQEAGYNHWEHFETLCNERGLEVDEERQSRLDGVCAYHLFTEDGFDLCCSCGEWYVTETELRML